MQNPDRKLKIEFKSLILFLIDQDSNDSPYSYTMLYNMFIEILSTSFHGVFIIKPYLAEKK